MPKQAARMHADLQTDARLEKWSIVCCCGLWLSYHRCRNGLSIVEPLCAIDFNRVFGICFKLQCVLGQSYLPDQECCESVVSLGSHPRVAPTVTSYHFSMTSSCKLSRPRLPLRAHRLRDARQ